MVICEMNDFLHPHYQWDYTSSANPVVTPKRIKRVQLKHAKKFKVGDLAIHKGNNKSLYDKTVEIITLDSNGNGVFVVRFIQLGKEQKVWVKNLTPLEESRGKRSPS